MVKDDRIVSIGYNGMPAGWNNNCEFDWTDPQTKQTSLVTRPEVYYMQKLMQSLSWQSLTNLDLVLVCLLLTHLVWTVPNWFTNLVSIVFIIAIAIVTPAAYSSWKKQASE